MSRNTARAGRAVTAMTILITNINVRSIPMSAWNFKGDKAHVDTPTAKVMAVKITAFPVSSSA
jgi:hypothetical protein